MRLRRAFSEVESSFPHKHMPPETMKGNIEANNLPKNAAEALKFANNRYNVPSGKEREYHAAILLPFDAMPDQEEKGKHWMRFHAGPDPLPGKKRRLVVFIESNRGRLTPHRPDLFQICCAVYR